MATKKTLDQERYMERINIHPREKEFHCGLNRLIAFSLEAGIMTDKDVMTPLENLLDPRIAFERKVLTDSFEQIPDKEVSIAQDDTLSSFEASLRQVYFNAGVLMGARLKGASIEDLRKLGERWWQM